MFAMSEIINYMLQYTDDAAFTEYHYIVNNTKWTLADLFIRQWKNNMCDGFGLVNVYEVYMYLVDHKEDLIKYNLLSKNGINNCGYSLWENYNIEPKYDLSLKQTRKKSI